MKNASKIIVSGLLIIWAGFCPQPVGHSQPVETGPGKPANDSLRILEEQKQQALEQKRRTDSAALAISRDIPPLARKLNRLVAARKERQEPAAPCPNIAAVQWRGEVYEVPAKEYRGYLVIDMDSVEVSVWRQDSLLVCENYVPHITPAAPAPTGWQKLWRFIRHPFKCKSKTE